MRDFLKELNVKTVCEITFEDVVKSMVSHPEQWTKEQIIDFLKENVLNNK